MAIRMINNGDRMSEARTKINDSFTEIITLQEKTVEIETLASQAKLFTPVVTGTSTSLIATQTGINIFDGLRLSIKLPADIGIGATLNYNGTGAKPIVTNNGIGTTVGAKANSYITVVYNGTNFILQGEGGGSGGRLNQRYGNKVGQISTYELAMKGFNPFYSK